MGERKPPPQYRMGRLRLFVIVTAVLHAGGFVAVLAFRKDQEVPLFRSYVMWPKDKGGGVFEFSRVQSTKVSMAALGAAFFALSCACQLLPAAVPALWASYSQRLEEMAIQPFRWIEYSASASCLFLLLDLINGVNDLHHAILVFVSMATVMLLGLVQELVAYYLRFIEQAGGPKRSPVQFFLPHAIGWLLYVVLWAETIDRFKLDMDHIHPERPPNWVVTFLFFLFVVFSSFGFCQASVFLVRTPFAPAEPAVEPSGNVLPDGGPAGCRDGPPLPHPRLRRQGAARYCDRDGVRLHSAFAGCQVSQRLLFAVGDARVVKVRTVLVRRSLLVLVGVKISNETGVRHVVPARPLLGTPLLLRAEVVRVLVGVWPLPRGLLIVARLCHRSRGVSKPSAPA